MKIFVILALIGACAARHCSWSDWSECKSPKKCLLDSPLSGHSYPVKHKPGYGEVDVGRMRMNELMKVKAAQWEQTARCRAEGTCPELNFRQSEGRVDCVDGMAGDNPCRNFNQLSFVDFQDLSNGDSNMANDIWGWTDPENGDEYAIVCLNCGTSFVRMTIGEEPVVVAYMPSETGCTSWRDVKTVNDYAYVVSEASNHGLQVFDLGRLRDLDTYTVVDPDVTRDEFGNAHNIVANEETDYIYVVGATQRTDFTCSGGLLIYDVSNANNPRYVACNGDDGYVHDAQCIVYNGPDADYQGQEICFNFNEDTFTIVDVTDKSNQIEVARVGYDGSRYTHQGWVTDDHTVVLMDDEADETSGDGYTKTYLWDITDLDNIELMNTYVHAIRVIDHNQYINEPYTYQSNYMGGLRVLEIFQETFDLVEVGYFDVYPNSDSPSFSGSWSNYPYFVSGNIPVTSMDFGLFIVEPDFEGFRRDARNKHFGEQSRTCGNKSQTRQCWAPTC